MTGSSEEKIAQLEKRVQKLEETIKFLFSDKEVMDEYYRKAKELVVKNQKASVIFLQRKLLIDFDRATRLLEELEKNGIIGPEEGFNPRKVMISK